MCRRPVVRAQRRGRRIDRVHIDERICRRRCAVHLESHQRIPFVPPRELRVFHHTLPGLSRESKYWSLAVWVEEENILPKILGPLVCSKVSGSTEATNATHSRIPSLIIVSSETVPHPIGGGSRRGTSTTINGGAKRRPTLRLARRGLLLWDCPKLNRERDHRTHLLDKLLKRYGGVRLTINSRDPRCGHAMLSVIPI